MFQRKDKPATLGGSGGASQSLLKKKKKKKNFGEKGSGRIGK
jgi:hypothetical protein